MKIFVAIIFMVLLGLFSPQGDVIGQDLPLCPTDDNWKCVKVSQEFQEFGKMTINEKVPIVAIWYKGGLFLEDGRFGTFHISGIGTTVVVIEETPGEKIVEFGFKQLPPTATPTATSTPTTTPTATSTATATPTPTATVFTSKPVVIIIGLLFVIIAAIFIVTKIARKKKN